MKALKWVSKSVVLPLVLTLAACSGTGGGSSTAGETGSPSKSPESSTSAATASPPKVPDLGGQTIKIGQWWDDADPRKVPADKIDAATQKQTDLINAAEKKYNCKIEFVKFGDYGKYVENFTTTSLAGQPFADVVVLELFWSFPTLANKGLIQPIDGWIDMKSSRYNDWMRKGGSFNGKQYGYYDGTPSPYGIFYNKTMVQKLGLEDPFELQKKGEWTWDKFRDFMKKATQDTNGDGKPDVYGFPGGRVFDLAQQLVYVNKGSVEKDASGQFKFSLDNENSMQALQFVSDLYNSDKTFDPSTNDPSKDFIAGKDVLYPGFSWEFNGLRDNMKDTTLGYVFFPKGPKSDKYQSYTQFGNMYFAPKYSKNAEVAMKIYDEINLGPEGKQYSLQGWQSAYPTPELVETRKLMSENIDYISYFSVPDGQKYFGQIVEDITKGKQSPSSAVEKVKPQFNAAIDKLLAESKQ
ncbi:extracellular solute-binding protein [Paenibacillus aurantius]|uniref:Extracellular solute-binding protein n=1 Tax=Paenibacillus aurantius TaxID=2918900 RepID=A0AA96LHH2_9BACL|nr:extracellular solute-binding protein [Paenibacillus aurantius]WNQ13068.1 extracellular solute-binding protein [Paenibacillus aurantius]